MSSLVAQRIKSVLFGKEITSELDDASTDQMARLVSKIPSGLCGGEILAYRHLTETGYEYCYYTFAGGLENFVLQLIFSNNGYECQLMRNADGIGLHASVPLDFDVVPDDENSVLDVVHGHWQRFRSLVNVGPFHELLPTALKRKEILSQVLYGSTIANVMSLRKAKVVIIPTRLF